MIWEFAGALRMDPGPYTWWELQTMYKGLIRLEWGQTSRLYLLIAAVNTPKGKPTPQLRDIHPLYYDDSPRGLAADTESAKAALKAVAQQFHGNQTQTPPRPKPVQGEVQPHS